MKKKKFKFNDLKKVITYKRVAFLSILIGVGIMTVFVYLLLAGNYKFSGKEISLDSIDLTYKVGSFLGAIIGPFWALAGVLLYYNALKLQKEDSKESQKAFEIQSFENTFFNLLKSQQEISATIDGNFTTYKNSQFKFLYPKKRDYFRISTQVLNAIYLSLNSEKYKGLFDVKEAAENIEQIKEAGFYYENSWEFDINEHLKEESKSQRYKVVNLKYKLTQDIWSEFQGKTDLEKIKQAYRLYFYKHHHEVGHYFRHLYNILKLIETSESHFKSRKIMFDHKKYANFVQAQMSSFELLLLFYNVILFPKAKELVLKYKVLDNLAKEDLINGSDYFEQTGIKLKPRDELLFS